MVAASNRKGRDKCRRDKDELAPRRENADDGGSDDKEDNAADDWLPPRAAVAIVDRR